MVTKGVYCLTAPDGRKYVGVGVGEYGVQERWNRYKRLDCKNQKRLLEALKEFGPENFRYEVILETDDEDNAYRSEMYLIDVWNLQSLRYGFNMSPGGRGGRKGIPLTEETKQKLSKAFKGRKAHPNTVKALKERNPGNKFNLGKPSSDQKKRLQSEAWDRRRKGGVVGAHKRILKDGTIVYWSNITVGGKTIYLGRFKTEQEASETYLAAVKKYNRTDK